MKEKIKNLRSTERGNAAFKLGLYLVFFAVVLLLIFLTGSNRDNTFTPVGNDNQEVEETKETTYLNKQKILLEGSYDFTYEITGEYNITYYGSVKDNVTEGFKETDDELIGYNITDGVAYRNDNKEVYRELYDGLKQGLFNLTYLFNTLNQTNSRIDASGNKKTYYYNIDDIEYEVITSVDYIEQIIITFDKNEYKFSFEY